MSEDPLCGSSPSTLSLWAQSANRDLRIPNGMVDGSAFYQQILRSNWGLWYGPLPESPALHRVLDCSVICFGTESAELNQFLQKRHPDQPVSEGNYSVCARNEESHRSHEKVRS